MATETPLHTKINDAAQSLGPKDQLDRRHRHGHKLDKQQVDELKRRRIRVVTAGHSIAKTYAKARKEVLGVVDTWIKKPTGESAGFVKEYLFEESGLVQLMRAKLSPAQLAGINARVLKGEDVPPEAFEGELVPVAQLGSKQRQAEYHLLRACFTKYVSDAAAGLRVICYAGASTYESSQNPPQPGGWGHVHVVAMITAVSQ